MKLLICLVSICLLQNAYTQATIDCDSIAVLRTEHATTLQDTSAGVLTEADLKYFKALNYFPCNEDFVLTARFKKDKGPKFEMPTSTERKPIYRQYGTVTFEVEGKAYQLTVYQNMSLRKNPDYKDYLFLPFRDATSTNETYGGGRYLDLNIPEDDQITLNFNKAYNPYCAYSYRYSCPIPPEENTLDMPILAGERTPTYHEDTEH